MTMFTLLLLILLSCAFYGYGAAIAALGLTLYLLGRSALGAGFGPMQELMFLLMVLAVPFAALLAGHLLDRFTWSRQQGRVFSMLGISLSLALAFGTDGALSFLEAALRVAGTGSTGTYAAFLMALGSAAVFCAALSAFTLMFLWLLFESAAHWLMRAFGLQAALHPSLAGLRPLFILMLICLLVHHLAGLYAVELWPTTLAGGSSNL